MEWRPIEEAPKPHAGLLVLWSGDGGVDYGFWVPELKTWFDWTDDYMEFQPSHFLDITPPKDT